MFGALTLPKINLPMGMGMAGKGTGSGQTSGAAAKEDGNTILKQIATKGLKLKWRVDIPPEGERIITELYNAPVIISEMPMEMKPFYICQHEKDPKLSYGFDLIMNGMELASGGRRIHDPEQYISALKSKGLNPKMFEDIIKFYRYGLPIHAGWAIGVDRLVMSMLNLTNVREAVLFPRDAKRLTP